MATVKTTKKGRKGGKKKGKKGAKRRSTAKHVKPLKVGDVTTKKVAKRDLPPYTYCGVDGNDHRTGKKLHIVKRYKGKTLQHMKDAHDNKLAAKLTSKAIKAARKAAKGKDAWEGIGAAAAAQDKILSKAPERIRELAMKKLELRQAQVARRQKPSKAEA